MYLVSKETEVRQTVKLLIPSSGLNPRNQIYRRPIVDNNQTAHISLQIHHNVKKRGNQNRSPETKINKKRPNLLGASRVIMLDILSFKPSRASPRSTVRRPVSASAPPVKGVLVLPSESRNPLFRKNAKFLISFCLSKRRPFIPEKATT